MRKLKQKKVVEKKQEPLLIGGMSRQVFRRVAVSSHFPRIPGGQVPPRTVIDKKTGIRTINLETRQDRRKLARARGAGMFNQQRREAKFAKEAQEAGAVV